MTAQDIITAAPTGHGYPMSTFSSGAPQYPNGQSYGVGFVGPGYPGIQNANGYSYYPESLQYGPPGQVNYGMPPQAPSQSLPNQPGKPTTQWMPAPLPPADCPPGLEYLAQIDQILIHQQVELLEAFTGFETNNKYEIKNSLGQRIYFAAEETDCCTRMFCGPARSFVITITDNTGREVITLTRPFRCSSCFFPCCLQELEVQAPPGTIIGYVIQKWHPLLPKFTIQNENREDVLKIIGPCVACSCFDDVNFEVKSLDETSVVGKITKQWSGFVKEAFTDADNFGVQFPMDLSVKIKAVMMGACFLVDFMFFEHSKQNDQHSGVWH